MDVLDCVIERCKRDPEFARKVEPVVSDQHELLGLVGESSGSTKAGAKLIELERSLEKETGDKKELWDAKLRLMDARAREKKAESGVQDHLVHREAGSPEEIKSQEFRDGIHKQVRQLGTIVDANVLGSATALKQALESPLRGYRRAKLVRYWLPKGTYLIAAILIFVVGASAIDDKGLGRLWKIGLALFIWGVEQFGFDPAVERWVDAREEKALKTSIKHLTYLRLWALEATQRLEETLNKKAQVPPPSPP